MPGAENSSLDNAIISGTSGSSQNITSQGQNAYTVTFLAASVTTHHQIQKQEDLLLNPTVVTFITWGTLQPHLGKVHIGS